MSVSDFIINEDGALVEYIGTETEVVIPESVVKIGIGNSVFSSASVKSVIIPKSVKSICGCAFSGCETLESVEIPNSVKTIGMGAFRQCNALKCKAIEKKNHQCRKPSRIRNGEAFEMHGKFT